MAIFTAKHQSKKRLQHSYFPMNIARFLRTPLLQITPGGCICKDELQRFTNRFTANFYHANADLIQTMSFIWSFTQYNLFTIIIREV